MTEAVFAGAPGRARRFYVRMAWTCLAVAVIGFMPSFFIPLAQGAFQRPPIFYFHGVLFFAWTAFFAAQATLAARGSMRAHREWGVLGAALACAMVISVFAVVIVRLNQVPPIAEGAPGSRSFAWIQVAEATYFSVCIVCAFATTRRPEAHKRFMLIATISLLAAPLGRWLPVLAPGMTREGAQPGLGDWAVFFGLGLGPAALFAAAMAFDWKTRGRISPIYSVGLGVFLVLRLTGGVVMNAPLWLSIADAIKHIPG
jgi:cell division protein FtsW (lipid II flippase)